VRACPRLADADADARCQLLVLQMRAVNRHSQPNGRLGRVARLQRVASRPNGMACCGDRSMRLAV
jgi:hypothetical protein